MQPDKLGTGKWKPYIWKRPSQALRPKISAAAVFSLYRQTAYEGKRCGQAKAHPDFSVIARSPLPIHQDKGKVGFRC